MNGEAGKGDTYRQVDQKKWDENYERIFGKKKKPNRLLSGHPDREEERHVEGEHEDGC